MLSRVDLGIALLLVLLAIGACTPQASGLKQEFVAEMPVAGSITFKSQ